MEGQLSYEEAKAKGIAIEDLKPTPLPEGVERTKTWTEGVEHVMKLERN